jgi:adenine-specific DNA glycosylase
MVPSKLKQLKKEKMQFNLAFTKDKILLIKRNEKRFWQSLWVPIETNNAILIDHNKAKSARKINLIHKLSHLELLINISLLEYEQPFHVESNSEFCWINKKDIDSIGVPKPIKDILLSL